MKKTKLAIIGSGPAGYTGAIYASRALLEPLMIAGMEAGGQLMYTNDLENFPGLSQGIKGPEFMMRLREQAESFGTEIVYEHVTAVDLSQRPFKLWTQIPEGVNTDIYRFGKKDQILDVVNQVKADSHQIEAEAVIVSTGATANLLGVPGEKRLIGKGVSTCAVCDAAFFKDKKVFVIGGGDSAMEDALALAKFTDRVTVVHRRDEFRASKIMSNRVLESDQIKVRWNTSLIEVLGQEQVEQIVLETDDSKETVEADGVFLAIGHKPVSTIFQGELELDEHNYIVTAQSPSKAGNELVNQRVNQFGVVPFPSMTSVKGVFAAGDVVDFRYRQAITAAGLGAAAALDAERWLEERAR